MHPSVPSSPLRLVSLVVVLLALAACDLNDAPTVPPGAVGASVVHLVGASGATLEREVTVEAPADLPFEAWIDDRPEWLEVRPADGAVAAIDVRPGPAPTVGATLRLSVACGSAGESGVGTVTFGFGPDGRPATLPLTYACLAPPGGGFDVDLVYYGERLPSPTQRTTFEEAARRWSSVIAGDLEARDGSGVGADACDYGTPALHAPVDDLAIFVAIGEIDGPGGTLGFAGPCDVRWNDDSTRSGLPWLGTMRFDAADLRDLERAGLLESTIVHEMGHVLGIGTLWEFNDVRETAEGERVSVAYRDDLVAPEGTSCQVDSRPGDAVYFTGAIAATMHGRLGGEGRPRVENAADGAGGGRCAHWSERHFGHEVMTGVIDARGGGNPLSLLTIGSLDDLGYEIAARAYATRAQGGLADDYVLPPTGRAGLAARTAGYAIHEHEILRTPRLPPRP